MKKEQSGKNYNMDRRGARARETEERIIAAATALWMEKALSDISLEHVAAKAGVTARTVYRKFESKEGLFGEAIRRGADELATKRRRCAAGQIEDILDTLLEEYEAMGDAVIRTIKTTDELDIAGALLEKGRELHRSWCAEVFGPWLVCAEEDQQLRLDAFVSATEIYLWHLLRREYAYSPAHTRAVMQALIEALTSKYS